jgi:hypothetical protein
MLSINSEGIVSLPDGRVVNTVAAAQFRLVPGPGMRGMKDTTPYSTPDEARQQDMAVRNREYIEDALASGLTVAMYGVAEGRRLDGSVATATTWWKVCAL